MGNAKDGSKMGSDVKSDVKVIWEGSDLGNQDCGLTVGYFKFVGQVHRWCQQIVGKEGTGVHRGWRGGFCILGFCAGAGVTLGTGALGSLFGLPLSPW